MHHHPPTLALVFAAALAYSFLFVNGPAATLGFLLVGILGGFALRSWRALPILALGILLGGLPGALRADAQAIRLLGKGAFGLLLAYVPLPSSSPSPSRWAYASARPARRAPSRTGANSAKS